MLANRPLDLQQVRERQARMQRHHDRLASIKKTKPRAAARTPAPQPLRPSYSKIFREQAVKQENKALLTRILQIASRPNSTFRGLVHSASLQTYQRKQMEEKIAHENRLLVKKIVHLEPFLSVQELHKKYRLHRERLSRLSRQKLITANSQSLPPKAPAK